MSGASRWLPLRYALREMRGGLAGFYVFIACIALGAMSIAGVGSLAASLNDGLAREGRVILGGDLSFSLIQREAKPDEVAFLQSHGEVSTTASLRAMSRIASGDATLVELKAVDKAYPLFGKVTLTPDMPLDEALAQRDGAYGAVADQTLLARLAIEPGARITVGNIEFVIRAALTNEPDKLSVGIGFGPRLMVSEEALRATGLLQPGSLVRWKYQVKLPGAGHEAEVKAVTDDARVKQPNAGWEIRDRTNASPQLERNVNRFTQFLTIVGLTALLVGGVGVGNAVKSHLDRKRATIATLKALGADVQRNLRLPLDGVDARRVRHVLVHHLADAEGGRERPHTQRRADVALDRLCGGLPVENDLAPGEFQRVDLAGDEIGVGDGGPRSAAPVAGRARFGSSALGAGPDAAHCIDPRDRPATGADLDHLDDRDGDRHARAFDEA